MKRKTVQQFFQPCVQTQDSWQTEIIERKQVEDVLRLQRDLAVALSSISDLHTALNLILETTFQLDGIDCGGIYLVDKQTGGLDLVIHKGLSPEFISQSSHYDKDTPHVQFINQGKPLYLRFSDSFSIVDEKRRSENIRSMVGIPVLFEGQVVAVLNLASHTHDEFSESDRTVMETIATQIGGVIVRVETEKSLRKAYDELELRVKERTTELLQTNQTLQAEIAHRKRMNEKLQYYATLFDNILDAIISTDLNHAILSWNRAAEILYGWQADEVIGKDVDEVLKTTYQGNNEIMFKQCFIQGYWSGEIIQYRRDGTPINILLLASLLRDTQGQPNGIVGVYRDITQRKRVEQQLAESEQRYRTLVETAPDAILLTDMDRTIRFCNEQTVLLFGFSSVDELYGKKSIELIDPRYITHDPLSHIDHVLASGNLRNIEYIMRRKDGSTFPAEVNSSSMNNAKGEPIAMIVVVRDISERKLTEQALMTAYDDQTILTNYLFRSRNLLRALLDGLDDGLLLLDDHGCVQTINKAMATLFNADPDDLVGKPWASLYPLITKDFPEKFAVHPQKHMQSFSHRTRYSRSDGTTRILDIHTIALHHENTETVEQVIIHVVDVTEHVQLQTRVIENERFAASGKLAATVAHEINTPLQSLQTFLKLAQKTAHDHERNTFLSYAQEEIQRVVRIVRQLLDIYRPGATVYGQIDIIMLCERVLMLIGKRLRDQRITIERHFVADLPLLWGRADELMQLLLNLIVNALEAMPQGGKLTLQLGLCEKLLDKKDVQDIPSALDQQEYEATARYQRSMIVIAISDTGCGIHADLISRIFEAFVTTKEKGTGLGLSISDEIVKHHGGTIMVQSQLGIGTTFTIMLPITKSEI